MENKYFQVLSGKTFFLQLQTLTPCMQTLWSAQSLLHGHPFLFAKFLHALLKLFKNKQANK